jgi:hypothetical protein
MSLPRIRYRYHLPLSLSAYAEQRVHGKPGCAILIDNEIMYDELASWVEGFVCLVKQGFVFATELPWIKVIMCKCCIPVKIPTDMKIAGCYAALR